MTYETKLEKKLGIKTKGRDATAEDEHHRPYEPTAYEVLDKLLESEYMENVKHLIDYGSGKGRVPLYLSWKGEINTIGVECNESFYQMSVDNQNNMSKKVPAKFVLTSAEKYEIPDTVDACYFFNPFSIDILQAVLGKIKESYYREPRTIRLFFYYPSLEFVGLLMTDTELEFVDEIDCEDILSDGNAKEVIMVFDLTD